jgi:hypothetical protein
MLGNSFVTKQLPASQEGIISKELVNVVSYCRQNMIEVFRAFMETTREGLFCEGAENYAVNQSGLHSLNDDDDVRQRLSRARHLRNQLAHYFLAPAGTIPPQWSYINRIQLIIVEDED